MRSAIVAGLVLLLISSTAHAETIAGRASVIDGDTIEIRGERIRILDIDAPESGQPCIRPDGSEWRCGQQAALALSDWIGARTVTCDTDRRDRYKRHLARCGVAGQDIAEWLASSGWGVPYRDCRCEVVRDAAKAANLAKVGIWSGTFMLPWEWRKGER
jgi:endonuclease YncB( thermonuclease family)